MTDVLAIMLVKDEVDIMADVLRSAREWCREIYVLDNGSSDGTWELLQELAVRGPGIVVAGRRDVPFQDGLRAEVFEQFRDRARPDTWWARLDADEYPVVDPRPVLDATNPWFDMVDGSMYQYYLTDLDAEDYEADPTEWLSRPVHHRVRWYANNWAEPRFVRHRATSRWVDTPWPRGPLRTSPVSVPIRHYQYRSPQQVQRRIAIRRATSAFPHEKAGVSDWTPDTDGEAESWRSRVKDHRTLTLDDGVSPLLGAGVTSGRAVPAAPRVVATGASRIRWTLWALREGALLRGVPRGWLLRTGGTQ